MNKSKKLTLKLFRGQNVSASRGGNECTGGAKNWKSISEAARLLDRWEYKTKIGPIEIFVCCVLTLLSLCPVGFLSLEKLNLESPQGRDLATSGCNKNNFQLCQSYSYIMRKVWYHQIWIQNNLGFMVSDLILLQQVATCSLQLHFHIGPIITVGVIYILCQHIFWSCWTHPLCTVNIWMHDLNAMTS